MLKTLKNRESIHIAKFAHDTRADTFFEESIHYHELILGMIRYIRERKGRPICIIKAEHPRYSNSLESFHFKVG